MPSPDPKDNERGTGSIVRQVVTLLSNIVLETPDNLSETIWRTFSILGLSSILISGFIVWRHPDIVSQWLIKEEESSIFTDRLEKVGKDKVKVMEHVSRFIHRQKPSKFALVSWPTATTGAIVWDSGNASEWPVTLNGLYSSNLIPAVGPMVFGECWRGSFEANGFWILCPIHDATDVWAFVAAEWPADTTENQRRSLRFLAERIESLIY